MALLSALRALTSFAPPAALPECDPGLLGDVLEAHGLAPLASHQLEHHRLGASAPEALRERLLTSYQGVVNDNLMKLLSLRRVLRDGIEGARVVVLEGAAYVEWLYPHLAFRPLGELRLGVRAEERTRFADHGKDTLRIVRMDDDGRSPVFSDGTVDIIIQEGLWPGAAQDQPLYERARPYRTFGPSAFRPAPEEALLAAIAGQALLGLHAPLITFVDVRELLRQDLDEGYVRARAEALGLTRALHGALLLVAHFFPEVADAAARLRPPLGAAQRIAVERIVEAAKDPARLRHVRGVDAAARLVVAPRPPSP